MTPEIALDDSEEIARSKMIQSNCPLAYRKLCVFARLLLSWTIMMPDTRRCRDLPDPFLPKILITRVISPGIILSRRLIERRRSKAGPRREYGTKNVPIFSGKIIRGPCKSPLHSAKRALVAIQTRTTSLRSTKGAPRTVESQIQG